MAGPSSVGAEAPATPFILQIPNDVLHYLISSFLDLADQWSCIQGVCSQWRKIMPAWRTQDHLNLVDPDDRILRAAANLFSNVRSLTISTAPPDLLGGWHSSLKLDPKTWKLFLTRCCSRLEQLKVDGVGLSETHIRDLISAIKDKSTLKTLQLHNIRDMRLSDVIRPDEYTLDGLTRFECKYEHFRDDLSLGANILRCMPQVRHLVLQNVEYDHFVTVPKVVLEHVESLELSLCSSDFLSCLKNTVLPRDPWHFGTNNLLKSLTLRCGWVYKSWNGALEPRVRDDLFEEMLRWRCSQLHTLRIHYLHNLTEQAYSMIPKYLSQTLEHLEIESAPNLSEEKLLDIISRCSRLHTLKIHKCGRITDYFAMEFLKMQKNASHLRELCITNCPHVSERFLHELSSMPNCRFKFASFTIGERKRREQQLARQDAVISRYIQEAVEAHGLALGVTRSNNNNSNNNGNTQIGVSLYRSASCADGSCECTPVQCHKCAIPMRTCAIEDHANICVKRDKLCDHCGQIVSSYSSLERHLAHECPAYVVSCHIFDKCDKAILRKDYHEHGRNRLYGPMSMDGLEMSFSQKHFCFEPDTLLRCLCCNEIITYATYQQQQQQQQGHAAAHHTSSQSTSTGLCCCTCFAPQQREGDKDARCSYPRRLIPAFEAYVAKHVSKQQEQERNQDTLQQ